MASEGDWFEEAKDDLLAAENLGQAKLYAAACFHCQQAVEKALKAYLIKKRGDFPKLHSLKQLAALAKFEKCGDEINLLEADYAVSRYPDSYGKTPRKLYNEKTFSQRLHAAQTIVGEIQSWMKS